MRGHSEEESHVIEPRPEVQGLPIYRPGRPGNVSADAMLNLAANENAWGPSPAAVEAWRRWDGGATYPDMGGQILKEALEAQWSVPSSAMLLGTGSGHLIKCLAETYLRPNDRVAAVHPTFSLYAQGASLMGAQVAALPGTGHQVSWAALPDWVADHHPRLVFLCTPNNPTGDVAPAAVIQGLLAALGDDGLLVLDEAYRDFSLPEPDTTRLLAVHANVVLLRTLSKAYGLAGLRVGALLAAPAVVDAVGRVREPFPVSAPALLMGRAAVLDEPYRRQVVAAVQVGRRRLEWALAARGWSVNPSQANFVWAAPPSGDAEAWQAELSDRGILVRWGGSFGVADHLRITVGTPVQEGRLLAALDDIAERRQASFPGDREGGLAGGR